MADAFKSNLEKFLMELILKVGDKSHIDEIQASYDELIDECILTI